MPRHKVLVADDHPDVADSLAALLEIMGHEVRCAYDGGDALAVDAAFSPDVVILDINMPVADGYEVARALRARKDGTQFIIAMTGASSRETAEKAGEAGFDVHFVKPVVLDDLVALLDEL